MTFEMTLNTNVKTESKNFTIPIIIILVIFSIIATLCLLYFIFKKKKRKVVEEYNTSIKIEELKIQNETFDNSIDSLNK